jgi:ATP-dependent Clp protease ATP-binding subunit ClpX
VFDDSAIKAVARKAIKLKTGARGLRTILEECMLGLMYSSPGDKTIDSIIIHEDFIEKKGEPEYIRKKEVKDETSIA